MAGSVRGLGQGAAMVLREPTITVRVHGVVAALLPTVQAGGLWSGAENEPLATPLKSWTAWVWQSVGVAQWCRISDQDSLVAGSVSSWGRWCGRRSRWCRRRSRCVVVSGCR